MIFFPGRNEIVILPCTKEQLQRRLTYELTLPKIDDQQNFIGWIEGDKFRISKKLNRPDNYVPIIKGEIDSSSKDSIIFLKYRLMYSTRMFLGFWSVLLLFFTLFFVFKYEAYFYGAIALVMGVVNYLIVYFNFKRQVRISHDLFINVFK